MLKSNSFSSQWLYNGGPYEIIGQHFLLKHVCQEVLSLTKAYEACDLETWKHKGTYEEYYLGKTNYWTQINNHYFWFNWWMNNKLH